MIVYAEDGPFPSVEIKKYLMNNPPSLQQMGEWDMLGILDTQRKQHIVDLAVEQRELMEKLKAETDQIEMIVRHHATAKQRFQILWYGIDKFILEKSNYQIDNYINHSGGSDTRFITFNGKAHKVPLI